MILKSIARWVDDPRFLKHTAESSTSKADDVFRHGIDVTMITRRDNSRIGQGAIEEDINLLFVNTNCQSERRKSNESTLMSW